MNTPIFLQSGAVVAHRAHNSEAVGSIPTSAPTCTTESQLERLKFQFLLAEGHEAKMRKALLDAELDVRLARRRIEMAEANCGRRVCAWCAPMRDLGPCPGIAAGQESHTVCRDCELRALRGLDHMEGVA